MNVVIIKHEDNGKYLFEVPEGKHIPALSLVMCETKNGTQVGTACCDSFEVRDEDLDRITRLFGTTKDRLKYILGELKYSEYAPINEEA